ncbi:MAG: YbaB/EbfC family nucleoid-associated protein, partial [Limisphaerales bacterium]
VPRADRGHPLIRFAIWVAQFEIPPMSSIGKLMKQAARMQQQMEKIQAELAARTVEATSGGGAVKVVARCDGSLASIKIDPQALNPADAQLVEDMILSAANQALNQAKEINTSEMGKVTQGFSIPGLM